MSLKSKISISILMCLLLTFFIYSAQVPSVHAWGLGTHRFIASEAIEIMPDDLDWFFLMYSDVIIDWSIKPDTVFKASDRNERYRHWYDLDVPDGENEYYRGGFPAMNFGVLPWAVEDNFILLVQSLRDEDWERAAQLMGVISHYTEDITQPLHATSDYNPLSNHVSFEHEIDSHLYEISIPDYVPQELDNIFEATMAVAEESYGFTGYTENKLSYWLIRDVLWNDVIQDITENRIRSAVQFTANVWYTAMIQADLETSTTASEEPSPSASEGLPIIVTMAIVTMVIVGTVSVLYLKRR
ncbi:MAG: zinc dependent phospholipase C family protein [Candidatus Hadarchaeaceae archaeon]